MGNLLLHIRARVYTFSKTFYMRLYFCFAILLLSGTSFAQHSLTKVWETDALLKVPESVLYDAKNNVLYVTNIDGTDPWAKDGKGSVGKVSLDGKIIAAEWITGLQAPKGMGLYKNKLYVADMNTIVVIDIQKETIEKTITVETAGGFNDISIGKDGVLWVSDSKSKKIYRIENEKPVIYLENLKGPNGVLMKRKDLYIVDAGSFYKVNKDKSLTLIAEGMEGNTDGIANVAGSDFLISCWQGTLWYITDKGEKQLLLDTRAEKRNTADLGYNPTTKTVYVPTFWKNSVVAYQVK
jgi:sugar lactone lactonase YvrE